MQSDKDNAPRLIIDLNSILNGALLGGKDPDALTTIVEGKVVSVNSARYGVGKFFARFVEVLREFNAAPRNVVGVWDGKNAKAFRQGMLPAYKASTRSGPEYEQLNAAREIVSQMMHDMGAHTVVCDGCEADDTIAYLVQRMRTRKNIVITGDGDLMVLVDDNTHVFRQGKLDENPYGPFPHKYITVYKALVGDASDKIPGAKGFGDAAFVKLVAAFGVDGLEAMEDILRRGAIKSLEEDVADLPVLKKIIDNEAEVMNSWRAARIYPDRVNTLRRPLQWRAGMVKQWHDLGEDDRVADLKGYYGTCTLVHAGNYEQVMAKLPAAFASSPFVSLDIETSVGEESFDWIDMTKSRGSSGVSVDVLGSKLTSMGISFGLNLQHTIFMTVDHKEDEDIKNITVDQCRAVVEMIPATTHIVAQNAPFELTCLHKAWGGAWADNGWGGFLPNVIDTKIGASYIQENLPLGLKQRSKIHLGYEQQTYEQTTCFSGLPGTLPAGGRRVRLFKQCVKESVTEMQESTEADENGVEAITSKEVIVEPAVFEEWETRSYTMRELTAKQVLGYGADDPICTAALHTYYRLVMELEGTWQVYLDIEQKPAYLTTKATMNGIDVDLGALRRMENEDKARLAEYEATVHEYLVNKGWAGTVCPRYTEVSPATVKEAVNIVLGPPEGEEEFSSRKRKVEALALEIEQKYTGNELASLLAGVVRSGDAARLTDEVTKRFDGKPKIAFNSPKQMQHLLYSVIGMTPRIVNKMTDKQREDEDFRRAFYARRDYIEGKLGREPTEYERSVWLSKASTDDTAIDMALHLDNLGETEQAVLKAYLGIKKILTLQGLFYGPYSTYPHWTDGRLHPQFNQASTVTRRHSSSEPNLQQIPGRGDGIKIRTLLKPRHKDWVFVSCDLSSQEIAIAAALSGDEAMLSCFVGDNKRDNHSLIAVQAAPFMWGESITYEQFQAMRKSEDPELSSKAKTLRDHAKLVNFSALYGSQAPSVAVLLKTDEETAQKFLSAKEAAFPKVAEWKAKVEAEAEETGLSYTLMGVPRHLHAAVTSPNSWERSKAGRMSSNYPVQSSSGEQLRQAMTQIFDEGVFDGRYRAEFVCPFHDEIVFQAHRDDVFDVLSAVHRCMTSNYAGMPFNCDSSIAIGRDFSCPIEIGEEVNVEKVQAALEGLFGEAA